MSLTIDAARLDELQEIMCEDFPELIETYLSDAEALLVEIRSSWESASYPELMRAAHSLKGASINVGADELAERCLKLESGAKAGVVEDFDGTVSAIVVAFSAVADQLRERLPH